MIYTLQYGTYTFPNQTFQLKDISTPIVTPSQDVRRRDQSRVLDGRLTGRQYKINGKIFSLDKGSLWSELNIINLSLHNQGQIADLKYRDDNISAKCRMQRELTAKPGKGLYEYMHDVEVAFISENPYVAGLTLNSQSRVIDTVRNEFIRNKGNYPTNPIFTFVAGTWDFETGITVDNSTNDDNFAYEGPIAAGQTLVVNCDAGCVLLQVGLTMVDAISYFSGDLFFECVGEVTNQVLFDGPTYTVTTDWYHRWYV